MVLSESNCSFAIYFNCITIKGLLFATDKATNELNTETDWGLIISLCDKIKTTSNG